MNETMNLNGMGIGGNTTPNNLTPIDNPVEQKVNEKQEEITNASENSNESLEENKSLSANNEMNFEDLDMIKELRADEEANRHKNDSIFSSMDFGPLKKYLEDDDVTDISYSNGGQLWLKTLSKGVYRVDAEGINDALIEKIAFQCSNVMGKTFNMAHPFLDSESAELRMNFIHDSIARNGIAVVFRKTPAKIRLEKEKLMKENYVSLSIHDFLIKAVQGHCNIIMCGETGSGKTEFLKYLASHTFENEKIVTVEDTLELHLDRIYPHRDIVAMKTNNIASYSDVLVTCMRQNPIWILLSEVRSAEAVTAVRNSISSGHFILSTIHADKAANIPYRLYSLLESNIDVEQFLNTIYRYVQIGVYLRGRFDPKQGRFVREIGEVTEFYVNDNNECISNTIYQKTIKGDVTYKPISEHLLDYLEGQGIDMTNIREANGDLEKAQAYTDEHEVKAEVVTPPVEEVPQVAPVIEQTPVVPAEVVTPPVEEVPQVAPVIEQTSVVPAEEVVTPPVEEVPQVAPVIEQTPVVPAEVVTPPVEEVPQVAPVIEQTQVVPAEEVTTPPVEEVPQVALVIEQTQVVPAEEVTTPPVEEVPQVAPVIEQTPVVAATPVEISSQNSEVLPLTLVVPTATENTNLTSNSNLLQEQPVVAATPIEGLPLVTAEINNEPVSESLFDQPEITSDTTSDDGQPAQFSSINITNI